MNEHADPKVECAHAALVATSDLRPNPRNPNKHPRDQIDLLAKNIAALGWRHPIIVSKLSGYIVAGHARLEAAKNLECSVVPVDYQDFSCEADELAYLIADNRIAELAEADREMLLSVIEEIDGEIEIDLTGFDAAAASQLTASNNAALDLDAPGAEAADEEETCFCPKCGFKFNLRK